MKIYNPKRTNPKMTNKIFGGHPLAFIVYENKTYAVEFTSKMIGENGCFKCVVGSLFSNHINIQTLLEWFFYLKQ